mgnify:FL=1
MRVGSGVVNQTSSRPRSIGVLIPMRDESPRITECIQQFKPYIDFILALDTGSIDNSAELALGAGADVVVLAGKTRGQDEDRNLGCSMMPAGTNWILISDVDERFPVEFLQNIHAFIEENRVDSFRLPRDNFGIRYRYPDYQVKLVKRWVKWIGHPHCLGFDPVRMIRIDQVSCVTLDQHVIQHLPRRQDIERLWWKNEPVKGD